MVDARHGKRAVHNWAQLPVEILRLVVANYLAYRPHVYLPSSWLHPDFHYQRAVFESLRDANDVQHLMAVCPQWHRALLNLDFWVAACRKLDRQDLLGRSMLSREAQAAALAGSANTNLNLRLVRNYNHFRLLSQACCIPCRINRPYTRDGIGAVKAAISTAHFGQVPVCKVHRNNAFCGICLKDISLAALGDHGQLSKVPESLFENEDLDTWPTVHTTCCHCRRDALVRTVAMYSSPQLNLLEFLGGPSLNTKDYEARSAVDSFVDMGETGVNVVVNILLERHWLRTNTNLESLLDQVIASARYTRAEFEEYESEEEMFSDEEDVDSYEMLQTQEELGGVRNLAITAWARARIMDGNWVSPGDIWCLGTGQISPDSQWDPSHLPPTVHPVPYSLQTSPSNESTSLSNSEIDETMSVGPASPMQQAIHYPAPDHNIPLPNFGFAQGAANLFRCTFRDILLDPMRHIVGRLMQEAQEARQDPCVRVARMDIETVLALLRDERTWYVNVGGGARLMNAIPYVPVSTQNLPPLTRSLVESLWREACAPLFQCQCSICDRAMRNQAQAQSTRAGTLQPGSPLVPPVVVPSQEPRQQIDLTESEDTPHISIDTALPSHPVSLSDPDVHSRKRSSAELDDSQVVQTENGPSLVGTPRKRQRTGEKDVHDDAAMSSDASPPAESPVELESGGGTGPGSPANSTGVPSETSVSSSASDSSSLHSVASSAPLGGACASRQEPVAPNKLTSAEEHIKVRPRDAGHMYEDPEDGVVYLQ